MIINANYDHMTIHRKENYSCHKCFFPILLRIHTHICMYTDVFFKKLFSFHSHSCNMQSKVIDFISVFKHC
jgi:hypothetical protein